MEHHQNAQVAPPYDMQQAQLTAMMFSLSQNGSSLSYPPPRSGFGGPSPNMWAPHVYPQNAFMGMPGMFTNSEALAQMAKMYAGLPPQTPEPCWRGPLLKGRGSSKGRFSKTKIGSEEDNEVSAIQSVHIGVKLSLNFADRRRGFAVGACGRQDTLSSP